MKYFIIRNGENVKHIERVRHNFTIEDVLVIDENEMPVYTHQKGKAATLKYNETDGLHYEYIDIPPRNEISDKELINMIEEVL